MSGTAREWQFSRELNARYYHDRVRNLYVTETGLSIPVQSSVPEERPRTDAVPRYVANSLQDYVHRDADYVAPTSSGNTTVERGVRTVSESSAGVRRGPPMQSFAVEEPSSSRNASQRNRTTQDTSIRGRRYSQTSLGGSTRPPLVDSSPGAIFLSADGQHDPLDPGYKRRDSPRKFFVQGKVFLTLWTEPAGDLGTSFRTVATNIGATYGKYGEKTYSGVRRFVVIKEGEQSCAALPIRSYSGHGAANRRDQAENGIVYTGRDAPERPAMEPKLLPLGIRVDPDDRDEKLDALSRINYGTVYIIEHNIKVKPYGVVNRDYIRALLQQFERVFVSRLGLQSDRATGAPSPKARALTRNPEHSTSQDDSRRSRDRNVPEDSKARHIAVAIAIERGRNSRARLQELADKPRSNEKRRDSGSQEHSQLTDLTNDERQELRSMFTRAMGVLTTTGGLSEEDAQEEAQRIVRTEVAKMISNNRERSRSDMPRESLSGKAQATFPISSTPRSSSLQPMTPALRAGKSALTGPAAQAIRDSATMRPGQVLNTVGQPDLRTQLTGRTRQPPNFRSAGPSVNQRSATEPIPTIAQLISGGWNENDATVFRQLMIDGWTADSATTIIRLIQKGVQLSDAKRIALMIENDDHLTLEDAVRLYQATRIH